MWKARLLRFLFLLLVSGFSLSCNSANLVAPVALPVVTQSSTLVTWTYTVKKISDSEFDLVFTAVIADKQHLYSQIPTDDGPMPTEFVFGKSADFKCVGKTKEPKPVEKPEPAFNNAIIRFFENKAVFVQRIQALSDKTFKVKGIINGMTCNDSQCTPFSPPFDFVFEVVDPKPAAVHKEEEPKKTAPADVVPAKTDVPVAAEPVKTVAKEDSVNKSQVVAEETTADEPDDTARPVSAPADHTWYGIFLLGFFGGFAALLTPCVFPMIPMTVSFFTKRSKTRSKGITNAFIYSAAIVVLYVALGLGVTFLFGSDALNRLSTNVWFNIFFFILLVVFAISFLGAFEIVLPSSLVNKVDSASDRGGLLGILFMAFALSLVSFSCTGPIIGTLLVEAATLGGTGPFWGMFGFALALALPFGLFAAFPGWMNSLPKSGGWLNSVKVFLGFLELALAFKFLSNADLVVQAHLITREVFLVIWIVLFALLGVYLMGGFKLSHDSPMTYLSTPRLLIAIVVFSFTVYLVPGLWGAPLKLISGFPPPQFYSESPQGFGVHMQNDSKKLPPHAHPGPNGITAFTDLKYAKEYAKTVNKPLMLDFTGWACVNCRKMEEQVWSDPEVKKRLNDDFVLVSLYVDEKTALPKAEQVEVEWNGKRTLKTVGNKWSYLQATTYKANSQPQYRIISADGERLSDSCSYDPDIQKYVRWLGKGLKTYKKKYGKVN